MNFLNELFLPPTSDQLHLIKFIIVLLYFIHIPFVSLMIGGTFFSIAFRLLAGNDQKSKNWRVAGDFIETLVFRKTAGIILGVLPLFALTLIEGQIFYDANIMVVQFLFITTILAAIGITLVYLYQSTFKMAEVKPQIQLLTGTFGLIFLLIAYFLFSVTAALVLDPGRWAVVSSFSQVLFSWNVVARFLHFLCAALAVSSVAMVFFIFNWQESIRYLSPDYAEYLKKLVLSIGLGFTLLQPVLLLWNLITLPHQALNETVFSLTIIVLFLLFIICLILYYILKDAQITLGRRVFTLFIITFVLMIVNDHFARESAIENQTQLLLKRAEEIETRINSEREQLMSTAFEPDLAVGEQVYNAQCNACHRFDKKLVGPAYNVVLQKYLSRQGELENFIRNPYKVDQNYPPMPKLGLNEKEIKSVVAYLFKKLDEGK
jgi:cytochrome c